MPWQGIEKIVREHPALSCVHAVHFDGTSYDPDEIIRLVQSGQATPEFMRQVECSWLNPNTPSDELHCLAESYMLEHAEKGTDVVFLSFHNDPAFPNEMDAAQAAYQIRNRTEMGRILAESHGRLLLEMKRRADSQD